MFTQSATQNIGDFFSILFIFYPIFIIEAELCREKYALRDRCAAPSQSYFISKIHWKNNSFECFRIELQRRLPWLAINEKNEKCTDTASMVTTMETDTRVAVAA